MRDPTAADPKVTPADASGPVTPTIVVTSSDPAASVDPAERLRRTDWYADAVRRAGARPIVIHPGQPASERSAALAAMDGLLLAGGPDLHPARFGQPIDGSRAIDEARDALEAEAWANAWLRGLPLLGICRGLQAINVFAGGSLLQHVDGHEGPAPGEGPALRHAIRLVPGTRLARMLAPTDPAAGELEVNSFHHQAVRRVDLAPGLVAAAWSTSPAGDIVEGLESPGGRFVVGVQCHPERVDSTPPAFEGLWRGFVDACRAPVVARRPSAVAAIGRRRRS